MSLRKEHGGHIAIRLSQGHSWDTTHSFPRGKGGLPGNILVASHLQRPRHSVQLRQSLSCYVKLGRQEREAPCQSDVALHTSQAHVIPADQEISHEAVYIDKHGVVAERPLKTTKQKRKTRKKGCNDVDKHTNTEPGPLSNAALGATIDDQGVAQLFENA